MDFDRYTRMAERFNKELLEQLSQDMGKVAMQMLKGIDLQQILGAVDPETWKRLREMAGFGFSSMPGDSPYKVLGLERTASDEAVRKRYKELLMRIHPDTAGIKGTEFLTAMIISAYKQIERERGWKL